MNKANLPCLSVPPEVNSTSLAAVSSQTRVLPLPSSRLTHIMPRRAAQDEIDEVLGFVHLGWPIVVMQGTGGLADRIAACRKDMHTFQPDERLMEVCVVDGPGGIEAPRRPQTPHQGRPPFGMKLWFEAIIHGLTAARCHSPPCK